MNRPVAFRALLLASLACTHAVSGFFDESPVISLFDDRVRARLSGTADIEGYWFEKPAPGLLFTPDDHLFNPRLTLFFDGQLGSHFYAFAQARIDRGFDPGNRDLECRLDEYVLRFTPGEEGRFNIQIGQFATVVGSWVSRHGSWENPFVTAPVVYENVIGIWDLTPAPSINTLLRWAFVRPGGTPESEFSEKAMRIPVIWGPSYATGAAVAGKLWKIEYAAEIKNQALSARPDHWSVADAQWQHPTVSGRVAYRPSPTWTFGVSASSGSYLSPDAQSSLAPGRDPGDYRQRLLAQEIGFAWRHWQLWAETFQARFEIPGVADVDVFAWYVETKYKFTPQFFGSLRWNEQVFGHVPDPRGGRIRWGRNLRRLDLAPGYRFSANIQLKLQFSLQHEESTSDAWSHLVAAQFTVRF